MAMIIAVANHISIFPKMYVSLKLFYTEDKLKKEGLPQIIPSRLRANTR